MRELQEKGLLKDDELTSYELVDRLAQAILDISKARTPPSDEERHVIFYASSFLQKPEEHEQSAISGDDISGFMNAFYKEKGKRLTLILHTPGGDIYAVESIIAYLHSKCEYIEVIVPISAMSGGAMITLASDYLIMSRAGQLGPVDPQLGGYSARAIQEGFINATDDILDNPAMAGVWAPILGAMGPSLYIQAKKQLSHSEELVSNWLKSRKLFNSDDKKDVKKIADYFNAASSDFGKIQWHNQRIGLDKLRELGLNVEVLEEAENDLQDKVLTAYHLASLFFRVSPAVKIIASSTKDGFWVHNSRPARN